MRPVIVGHDGSAPGEDALALGELLRDLLAAPLIVARVLPWSRDLLGPKDVARALEAETGADFAALSDRLGPGVSFRPLAERSPARALHELAADERAAIIVVGSSHRGTIGRTLLGSTGSALLAGAPSAVAIAPKGLAGERDRSLGPIGVAIDGSAESWSALETAIALAERARAKLALLHVLEPPTYGYSEALGVLTSQELQTAERLAGERVARNAESRVPAALEAETRLLNGSAGRALAEASAGLGLLVCGSRGYGPLRHAMLGGTSRSLIANAHCPVLVLPRAAGVDPLQLGTAPTGATAR